MNFLIISKKIEAEIFYTDVIKTLIPNFLIKFLVPEIVSIFERRERRLRNICIKLSTYRRLKILQSIEIYFVIVKRHYLIHNLLSDREFL